MQENPSKVTELRLEAESSLTTAVASEKESAIKMIIPWVIAIALFMETLDITIISTAIPKMAVSLAVSPISLKFALTCYLLSLAVFIPISGWLADRFGAKRIFAFALLLFTVSSMFCGLANNLVELVLARILQGVGGSLMMPVGRLILLKTFPKHELVRATNYVTIPSLIGPALGPLVGGFITTFSSWRYIFYVNVPFGLMGFVLALKYVTNYKTESPPFDFLGFILIGLSLAGLSFSFESVGEHFVSLPTIILILTASALGLIVYLYYHLIADNPVFDLKVFRIPTFRITVLGSLCSRLGLGGVPFLLPLLFQLGFGLLPIYSGLLTFPMAIGMLLMKFYVKPLLKLFGFRNVLMVNTVLVGLSLMSFSFIEKDTSTYWVLALVFLNGIVTSLQFSCMNVLSYVDLDHNNMSKGTSIASSIQQLSMCFGVAVSALLINYFVGFDRAVMVGHALPFHQAFFVMGLLTLATCLLFMRLSPDAGQGASGHGKMA